MPDLTTVRIQAPDHYERPYTIINEADYDPDEHTLYEEGRNQETKTDATASTTELDVDADSASGTVTEKPEEDPICGAEKASGGTCTRSVGDEDERCWQHEEE